MASERTIGSLIDSLGVTREDQDGELIAGAVVILKTVDEQGRVGLGIVWSDGMSWLERIGMLRAAERTDLPPEASSWDDED